MALVLKDRVKETTTSTGTGTITLAGAVVGYQSFSAIGNSNTTYYTIADQTGSNWEVGIGTYTASGTTLARTTVLSSSNAGSLVNFGAGTKDVFVTYPSEFSNTAQIGDVVLASGSPAGPGAWLEAGKYYSKATYPELATKLGSVADFGPVTAAPQAKIPAPYASTASLGFSYLFASNGTTAVVVGQSGAIFKSTDGLDWTPVASQTTNTFFSVTHLNGNFIAAGTSVCTSTDGTTWVNRLTPLNLTYSAAFGNGTYVLVGALGVVAYSSNLTSWTQFFIEERNSTKSLNKVIYANSLFVAVGTSGFLFTSPDGITWTSRSAGSTTFTDVVYANSLFVAVGQSGVVYTSPDGVTWTSRSAGGATFYEVIYANSLFVAVGETTLYTSTDGTTWTSRTIPQAGMNLSAVDWNGSNFVAVAASNGGYYFTSPTGTTWTAVCDASLTQFYSVFVFSGKTIALGVSSSVVLAGATRAEVLQNGTWNFGNNSTTSISYIPLAYNGSNQYVVVGNANAILTSSDGTSWTAQTSVTNPSNPGTYVSVSYLNGNYIVTGSGSGSNLFTSPNGTTWTSRSAGGQLLNASAFGASTYVVVGDAGNVYSSTDLVTWTSRSAGAANLYSVIFANSLFVAVGNDTNAQTSPDGITWTSRAVSTTSLNKVIYANSLFVALGVAGGIFTSSNGTTWTTRTSGVGVSLVDVAWSGSVFCAIGGTGVITTSPDGATWTVRTPGDTSTNLQNISWDGSKFLVSTNGGGVWTSPNGITWTRAGTTTTTATRYSAYLGGRFISVATSNNIQTSTDGFTWTASTNVQYVPASGVKVYRLGGNYYVLTAAGLFQSTDGVSFSPVRQTNSGAGQVGMAYSGSVWLLAVSGVGSTTPAAIYRSTNGTTWVKAAEFYTRTTASIGTPNFVDVAYAGGNFILGTNIGSTQGVGNTIYTSSDGITWTARQFPYNAAPGLIASDGTTAATTSANNLYKSTNGGVTWTSVISTNSNPVIYSNGAWVLNSLSSYFASPDLSTFYSTGITATVQVPAGIYVSGNYITGTAAANTMLFNKQATGYAQIPNTGDILVTYILTGKEIPVRSTTGLFLVQRSTAIHPTIVAERPLYSYDTATTFWIPPSNAGAGQKAYVYAGA